MPEQNKNKPKMDNDTLILILTNDGLSPSFKKFSHDRNLLSEEPHQKIITYDMNDNFEEYKLQGHSELILYEDIVYLYVQSSPYLLQIEIE